MSICWLANAVACVAITYWALIHLKHGKYELIGAEFVQKAVVADQEAALKVNLTTLYLLSTYSNVAGRFLGFCRGCICLLFLPMVA